MKRPSNKLVYLQLSVMAPLRRECWAEQAFLPYLMTGPGVGMETRRYADRQEITLRLAVVHERYALGEQERLQGAVKRLTGLLHQPAWERFTEERDEQIERVQALQEDRQLWAEERFRQLLDGENWVPPYGEPEQVEGIILQRLQEVHARLLTEAEVRLYVVGDVEEVVLSESSD